jgi:2,3-dihydroxybenzoate-AMP ligase
MLRSMAENAVGWPGDAVARYVAKGYWEGRSLGSQLAEAARKTPDAPALVDSAGEVRLTHGELLARADGAAVAMRARGLRPGDRVVVQLPNCWELVVLAVACLRLGVVPVWTLPQHRRHEISGVLARTEASAIVVPDVYQGFDHQALAHQVGAQHVLVVGDDVRPDSVDVRMLCEPTDDPALAAELDTSAPAGDAVAMVLLSGGTTGLPKLIARTHNDLGYMIKRAVELCEFGPDTAYLSALPLGHGFPLIGPGVLGALLAGGRAVIVGSPAPAVALDAIARERVTATSVVPAIVQRWLEHREADSSLDLSSLDLLQVGAARLADGVAARITPELGCRLQQVFGMSEGLLCLTRLDDPPEVVNHTQGRPISPDDEIRVVDAYGEPVPPGEPGELLTRGPYTIRGYYRSPELDAVAFVDGWYRSGDVVRQTPGGNLIVAGREKDVINRGGEKISAEEIENFAYRVDGVRRAAAVAMPDAVLGEAVCLYVVTVPGERVDVADVRAVMVGAGVARFKLPERLVTVDELPSTPVGKVDKKALRADITRRLAADGAPAATRS